MLGIIWKPVYFYFHWYIMIVWQERAEGNYIRRNVKNKCSKIVRTTIWKHDVLFRRISVQWMGSGYMFIRLQKENAKHDIPLQVL